MGPISGLLWLLAALVAAFNQALPHGSDDHRVLTWSLIAVTIAYGVGCAREWIDWRGASIGAHAAMTASMQPFIGVSLWLTGGVDSYMGPLLVLPMIYIAYFFPPRYAWPLVAAAIATYSSPALYASHPDAHLLSARSVSFGAAFVALTFTVQFLKRQLVLSERTQRRMAHEDALTGLANRRAFDEELAACLADAQADDPVRRVGDSGAPNEFALLIADIDAFKAINDTYGHTSGDHVLRALAARASAGVRPMDCLARIGGDELAIVAPGAGEDGARRLTEVLAGAAADVRPAPDADPLTLTVAWAVFPTDGPDVPTLMRVADQRLHAGKRANEGTDPSFASDAQLAPVT
jgi:diguanylate cyclase (GGDEF)-like protein